MCAFQQASVNLYRSNAEDNYLYVYACRCTCAHVLYCDNFYTVIDIMIVAKFKTLISRTVSPTLAWVPHLVVTDLGCLLQYAVNYVVIVELSTCVH